MGRYRHLSKIMMNRSLNALVATLSLAIVTAVAADKGKKPAVDASKLPPVSTKSNVTYAADIKPMFEKSCVRCHGEQKPKAHLRLDSLEGIQKGSEDGKVVIPGDSAGSVLVHNISHLGDPDDYMPPPHNKAGIGPLSNDQIGVVRAWIDQGAK